jgi:tetratricopeptide (TPR) repeat protein
LALDQDVDIATQQQPQTYFNEALASLRAGDFSAAVSSCNLALEKFPGDANLLCLCARAELAMGKFTRARDILEDVTRKHPDFAVGHDVSGDVLFAQGYVGTAIKAYEQALRLDPTRPATLKKIEKARQLIAEAPKSGASRPKESSSGRQMAFAEEMHHAEQFSKSGDKKRAENIYRGILKRDPNHVEAARMLARIAAENNHFEDAEVFLRHALSIAPDYTRLRVDLVNVLNDLHRTEEALQHAEKVLELAPDMAESHVIHASALGANGLHHDAIEAYEKALQISPDRPAILCSLAHHLKTVGDQDQAIARYRESIALKPDHAQSYWSMANLKTFKFEESEVEAMRSLLASEDLSDESRVQIHNALGLDREARGDYDSAFSHISQCNILRRKVEEYDPVETETRIDRNIDVFDEEFIQAHAGNGNDDPSPIFVVGLPRSGSTLIEQILASHSLVDGTHELFDLAYVARRIRGRSKKKGRFPDTLLNLQAEDWQAIGTDYIESTRRYRADAPYFVDKNPNNFAYIGLIKLALPNAKIINAMRHPLDSCFGSYKQLFASGQQFTYDLTEIGEYYLQYRRVVDHFHDVLPGFVLDVRYENVVADLEKQVRRILDFCGLPFEDECLRFHETERAVKTASSEQVRQPIYSSSVNLWRNYESHLDELIETLEPVLAELPAEDRPVNMQKN